MLSISPVCSVQSATINAMCAIAKLTWYSKYLLQYFSIYYQNLTLSLSTFLHQAPHSAIPLVAVRVEKFPAWEKVSEKKLSQPDASKSRPYLSESFFKWSINGRLNLQHSLKVIFYIFIFLFICTRMNSPLNSLSAFFSLYRSWRIFDYIICNAKSIEKGFSNSFTLFI